MGRQRLQFIGPSIHPVRKWLIGFSVLAVLALVLMVGLFSGVPRWMQYLYWVFYCFWLIVGSFCQVQVFFRRNKMGNYPQSGRISQLRPGWLRWFLDESTRTNF
jgi:hypothetical protein